MKLVSYLKALGRRSNYLIKLNASIRWRLHVFIDWWGTKIWTKTSEVVTPLGFKLTSGLHPAYHLMRTGKFEVQETVVVSKVLKNVDVFVDIGANLGYYTCLALQEGKPVIAFEPQQQNLQCLFQNLIANGWQDKAEVFPLALSDSCGLLDLYGASGPSASLIKNWAGYSARYKKTVPVSTLDNVLAGRFLGQKLFVKMDVEGAEFSVLKGALNTISQMPKPVWLLEICLNEFHPQGRNPDFLSIFQLFWDYGYKAYTVSSAPRVIDQAEVSNWFSNGHAETENFNYIFVDPDDAMNFLS
ncbi:FkbM family methyltransferase [Thalassospira sp.]|uniref:FkbM family methyltransferase n=1 Tax=Thalassospira sp. TaxID=1912094 RepID=UPI0025F3EE37|nr:FkbM family methyltransferase [Thalassospira sp.]